MATSANVAKAYMLVVPKLDKDGMKEVEKTTEDVLESAGSKGGDKFSTAFSGKAKLAALAVAAAVVDVTKSAIEAYSSYEQLVGGVDTLFGDSSARLQEYAAAAYKTAGMSANEYMETATSFSASLLQSLEGDTEAAVEYADLAITDMSDNANKMGTSMESIQNAYQGFAKQNYTMLDNLKLGYGGTKSEMQRLLADAQALSGIEYDINSYAEIVSAIHVIQTEIGMTGTTAAEAAGTIQGSITSAKAAYKNWLVSLAADNGTAAQATDELVASLVVAFENVVPLIGQVIGSLVTEILTHLPDILYAGLELAGYLIKGIGDGLANIVGMAAEIAQNFVQGLIDGIESMLGNLGIEIAKISQMMAGIPAEDLEIESPSKVMMREGAYAVEGFALGIENSTSKVASAVGNMVGGVMSAPMAATAGPSYTVNGLTLNGAHDIENAVLTVIDGLKRRGAM